MDKFKSFVETMALFPRDMYAVLILATGAALLLGGQKDGGMLIVGGALAVFKGDK